MERHQHAGIKKYCPIWGRLWYKLLANKSFSHNKLDGFSRERATLGDETVFVESSYFQKDSRDNIEHECLQFFGISRGSHGHFFYIN